MILLYYLIFLISINNLKCLDDDKRPIIQELFSSNKLIENKQTNILCQISNGKKPITFQWFIEDKEIKSNDEFSITNLDESSLLNIKSMTVNKSMHKYLCIASNQFGFDKKSITFNLNYSPKWKIEPTNKLIKLNSFVSLICDAVANPMPKIIWQKLSLNGELIDTYNTNEIIFKSFKKSNSSNYKCVADNHLGKIEKQVSIKDYGK